MSTSPLPPDPYEALGIDRNADADAVKKAHRKLVLKHHPDRIKDPALVEYNKNEFQKVQQAYEVLIDPARRQRYDDECRLAQLRRERMMSDAPRPTQTRTTTYTMRPSAAPSQPVQREYQPEARYAYEERVPDSPYVETATRGFEDSIPRANARKVDPKVDPYEKRSSASKPAERKEKPKTSGWERHGPAMKMAFAMKAKAQDAKRNVRDQKERIDKEREAALKEREAAAAKERDREMYAKAAKARDKEEAKNRDMKNSKARPAFVEDESDDESSGSDADTIRGSRRPPMRERSPVQKTRRTVTPEPTKSRRNLSPYSDVRLPRQQSPRAMPRAAPPSSPRLDPRWTGQSSPRPTRTLSPRPMRSDQRSVYDDEDDSEDEKYKRHFRHAQDYQNIAARKDPRPTPSRQGSDIREYWQADTGRKSGSDSDKQRSSSSQKPSRRSMPDEGRLRPPLPTQTSAPAGVRNTAGLTDDPRAKPRSRQSSYVSSNHRREIPELKRSGSEPGPSKVPTKRDSVPIKGSSLKQTESVVNHDSGYGSNSGPQTPENRGDSPPRESRPRETSTKYQVRRDEDAVRARKMAGDDGVPLTKYLSPEMPQHHSHHHRPESRERHSSRSRDRGRDSDDRRRSSSNRPVMAERRPSISRNESSARFEEREKPRNIRMEKSPDRNTGYFRWDGEVKQTRPKAPTYQSAHAPNISKFYEGSTVSRSANVRRPSVY